MAGAPCDRRLRPAAAPHQPHARPCRLLLWEMCSHGGGETEMSLSKFKQKTVGILPNMDRWKPDWNISEFLPPRQSAPKSPLPWHPLWVSFHNLTFLLYPLISHHSVFLNWIIIIIVTSCPLLLYHSLFNRSFKGGVWIVKVDLQSSLTSAGTTSPSTFPPSSTGLYLSATYHHRHLSLIS